MAQHCPGLNVLNKAPLPYLHSHTHTQFESYNAVILIYSSVTIGSETNIDTALLKGPAHEHISLPENREDLTEMLLEIMSQPPQITTR